MTAHARRGAASGGSGLGGPPYGGRVTCVPADLSATFLLVTLRDRLDDALGDLLGPRQDAIGAGGRAIRWASGGFLECSDPGPTCRWLLVDPRAVHSPEHGTGDAEATRAAVERAAAWDREAQRPLDFEAFLAFADRTPLRAEFSNGRIFVMAGGTLDHARIISNALVRLSNQLDGTGCEAFASDAKLRIVRRRAPVIDALRLPDVMVVCGEIELAEDDQNAVINPSVLIEVASPSTEAEDRDAKLREYRSIVSLRHYLLVATASRQVEVWSRGGTGRWPRGPRVFRAGERIELVEPTVSLEVDALYARTGVS